MKKEALVNEDTKRTPNKITKFLLPILAIVIIIIGVIGYLKISSKLETKKIIELLTKDQNIVTMFENGTKDITKNGERTVTLTLESKALSAINPLLSLIGNEISLESQIIAYSGDIDQKIDLKLGDSSIQNLEVVKNNELVAIKFPTFYEKFMAIEYKDISNVLNKLNLGSYNMNTEEIQRLKTVLPKYITAIDGILNKNATKEKSLIKIQTKTYDTTMHKVVLGTKEFDDLMTKLIETLKEDDESLEFISKKMTEMGFAKMTKEEFKTQFKDELENECKKLKNKDYSKEEIVENIIEISLYEYKGKTLRSDINYKTQNANYYFTLTAVNEEEDYILAQLFILEKNSGITLDLIISGKYDENGNYNANIKLVSGGKEIPLLKISVENREITQNKPRKISELDALFLNEVTNEELEEIKSKIKELMPQTNEKETEEDPKIIAENTQIEDKASGDIIDVVESGDKELESGDVKDETLEIPILTPIPTPVLNVEKYRLIDEKTTEEDAKEILGDKFTRTELKEKNSYVLKWRFSKEHYIELTFSNKGKIIEKFEFFTEKDGTEGYRNEVYN